jgi:P-type E1-E2 ATPase
MRAAADPAGSRTCHSCAMRAYQLPGAATLEIEHLVLDLNGTLSERGSLIDGVADRLRALARDVELHLVTADTLGTAQRLAAELPVSVARIAQGSEKADVVRGLGPGRTAAIGNGRNDAAMLRLAAIGIAVIGREGAATSAVIAADAVCVSILDALDLLLDERTLASTLRP